MMLLPLRIEHALDAAVQRAHDADPREQRGHRAAERVYLGRLLPKGVMPSLERRPSVSRRCVTELCPRSCKPSSVLSEVLRT
jgi:hypothetical protein